MPNELKFGKNVSAGEGKIEVEGGYLVGAQIFERAVSQVFERDRGVEIVKDVEGSGDGKDFVADTRAFGTVAGVDDDVGIADVVEGLGADGFPIGIKMKTAEIGLGKIAPQGVVGYVLFIENNLVTEAMKCAQDGAVRRGMAVSPGRGDGETENRKLQRRVPRNVPKGTYLLMVIESTPLPWRPVVIPTSAKRGQIWGTDSTD